MDSYVVALEGVSDTRPMELVQKQYARAATRAVNRTADRARTAAARDIREQVALPPSYLSPSGGRLTVSKRATEGDPEAIITGRQRPTSLARFSGGGQPGAAGVTVTVAPGFARFMKKAFLIRLRAGTADLDTRSNLGLAIRLKPGETIRNKKQMIKLSSGLYLLYGPSVDSVFKSVREDIAPDTSDFLAAEFARLMELNP